MKLRFGVLDKVVEYQTLQVLLFRISKIVCVEILNLQLLVDNSKCSSLYILWIMMHGLYSVIQALW